MDDSSSVTKSRLDQIAEGDVIALAQEFERYRPRLRRMVQLRLDRRLRGRVDPSDVLQETYIEVSKRAAEMVQRGELQFFLWLRMMTGQKLLEVHRRHLKAKQRDASRDVSLFHVCPEVDSEVLASQMIDHMSTASHAIVRAELQAKLEEILKRLDRLDREILTLRHFEELSNREVAQLLGIGKTAASNRYIRALVRLKEQLVNMPGFLG